MLLDSISDPFGERSPGLTDRRIQLLGATINFQSNSRELMGLVDCAYRDLPKHRLAVLDQPLRVSLMLTSGRDSHKRNEPPPLAMISGSGLLGGTAATANFVVVSPREHAALVVVSPAMLRFAYHARYELIEFAVFTLAARAQRLVSLHAACIGLRDRAMLLFGPSGAGKSTVALHSLFDGFDFLSEDSVFVRPDTLQATGVSNFVHIRANSLRWLNGSGQADSIRQSPVIRRRSGVAKFEVDLRREGFRIAKKPLKIVGLVFLSPESAGAGTLLQPIARAAGLERLALTQAYGASQPQWREFSKNVSMLTSFELRRGNHPHESVTALRNLLMRLSK